MTSLPKITPDNLLEIEARANAATEGPWSVYWEREGVGSLVAGEVKHTNNGLRVADWLAEFDAESLDGDTAKAENDGEFVAHARTDIPALCAALREAWVENERLREADQDLNYVLHVLEDYFSDDDVGELSECLSEWYDIRHKRLRKASKLAQKGENGNEKAK